ncbi:MAG: hypothetical protein V4635_10675 [Bacteroidota bacterium]
MEKDEIIQEILKQMEPLKPGAHMCHLNVTIRQLSGTLTIDWEPIVEEMENNNWIELSGNTDCCYITTELGKRAILR